MQAVKLVVLFYPGIMYSCIHFLIKFISPFFQGNFIFDGIVLLHTLNIKYWDISIEKHGYLRGKLHFQKFKLFYF